MSRASSRRDGEEVGNRSHLVCGRSGGLRVDREPVAQSDKNRRVCRRNRRTRRRSNLAARFRLRAVTRRLKALLNANLYTEPLLPPTVAASWTTASKSIPASMQLSISVSRHARKSEILSSAWPISSGRFMLGEHHQRGVAKIVFPIELLATVFYVVRMISKSAHKLECTVHTQPMTVVEACR